MEQWRTQCTSTIQEVTKDDRWTSKKTTGHTCLSLVQCSWFHNKNATDKNVILGKGSRCRPQLTKKNTTTCHTFAKKTSDDPHDFWDDNLWTNGLKVSQGALQDLHNNSWLESNPILTKQTLNSNIKELLQLINISYSCKWWHNQLLVGGVGVNFHMGNTGLQYIFTINKSNDNSKTVFCVCSHCLYQGIPD